MTRPMSNRVAATVTITVRFFVAAVTFSAGGTSLAERKAEAMCLYKRIVSTLLRDVLNRLNGKNSGNNIPATC